MNIDFESRNITRRSFLKGAGVVGAAGLLSACGGSKSNNSGSTAASGAQAPNSTGATPSRSTSPGSLPTVRSRAGTCCTARPSAMPMSSPTCGTA